MDIFFVLSGFLITAILIKEFDDKKSVCLKRFYMRRVLRLAPALLLLLLVFSMLSIVFLEKDQVKWNLIDVLITVFYASNWARAFDMHPPNFLGHTWSLSIEEQFYILWPAILIFLLRRIKTRGYLAVVVLFMAIVSWAERIYLTYEGYSVPRLYNGLDSRADALLVGCVLGIIVSSNLITPRLQGMLAKYLAFLTPLSLLGLLGVAVSIEWVSPHMYYWLFFVVELMTALVLLDLLITKKGMLRTLLSAKWIVWIGSISYGLYLWHFPVYRTMVVLGFAGSIERLTVGIFVTFILASLSYYLVERSFLGLKDKYA